MNLTIRNNLLLLLGIIILSSAVSCRKGENDPFFSFRSRKARLLGEWELKSGTIVTRGGTITDSTIYDGSTYLKYLNSTLVSGTYTHRFNFERSGSFLEEIVTDNAIETIEGAWMFSGKNKEANLKSKECVILLIESDSQYSNGITDITTYTGTSCPSYVMNLDELRNNKLTIIYDGSISNLSSSVIAGSLSFEKK